VVGRYFLEIYLPPPKRSNLFAAEIIFGRKIVDMLQKTFLTLALLGGLVGCESGKDDPAADVLSAENCYYSSRKIINTFDQVEGVIVLTTTGTETEATISHPVSQGTPYCACNLPASFFQDSLRVRFSAQQKEVYPNEKWKCLPLILTSISPLTSKGTSE